MARHSVRIGLVQLGTEPFEVEKNRAATVEAADRAFVDGADIVILPEMAVHGYVADARRLAPVAEPVDGPTTAEWRRVAANHDGYIAGGLCERDGDALYNSAVLVGRDGVILHYRKVHLFADEKVAFRPGDLGFPVGHTRFATVGLCVCYDLRFVEAARIMALRGADLICVPTAWLPGFDQERWDERGMCPQAYGALFQSNLNQTFIACASQVGIHGGLEFLGSSLVADPYGKVAVGPLSGSEDQTVVVEVDIAAAKHAQVRGPLIAPRADRRTDVYGLWTGDEIL
jgi:N-carbamoylputrescine amidase